MKENKVEMWKLSLIRKYNAIYRIIRNMDKKTQSLKRERSIL